MNIKKMYESSAKIRNDKMSNIIYKFNKLILNLLYDRCTQKFSGVDDTSDIIVSLTSFPARIDKVHKVIKTLLNQSVRPKKVILWLAEDEFPNKDADLPQQLLDLKKYGLTISYCENLFSHKKYYGTLRDYPECDLITVDDDVFYPENMIENLIKGRKQHPGCICANICNLFQLDDDGDVYSYDKWDYIYDTSYASIAVFPVGMGGVLYSRGLLNKEVLNADTMKETAKTVDDLWLRAMGILNKSKAVVCNDLKKPYFTLFGTKKNALYHRNVGGNGSKDAWAKIMKKYPQCREILLDEYQREKDY